MAVAEARVGTATVLFTDLVGSTALRARLGEDAADALREKHDALVHGAITSRQGVVVKHTGDGVMATFSAAVDAVAAGVAIQQALDDHNRRGVDERLEVRVGISVGDVSFSEGDCFGLPVVEAQRLEAAAAGGQILCADLVNRLARGRGGFEFASVGALELKGLPEPVAAVEVRWEPVIKAALPRDTALPSVLSGPRVFELAGRADELDALLEAWKDAGAGRRRVVFLSGEPGIGKTRLAVETALAARDEGALVLAGRCDEELVRPFQPFAESLRHQLELRDLPAAWLGPLAGELTRLMPDLPDRVAGLRAPQRVDVETQQALLFDAVTGWLQRTASSVPVLLVLDDLQWADRPTLLLLRHVIRETPNASLCIIGTYRSTDLDRSHPLSQLVTDVHGEIGVSRLAVDGLTPDGVAELLARAADHDLDDPGFEFAAALSAETGGNPLFAGEIVRHLVESGALVVRDGRWTSDLALEQFGLPDTVREVIGRRVSRLDGDTQRLLSAAAVIGHDFAVDVLASVSGTDEDHAIEQLDAARSGGLVDETGQDRYRFGHALVRATLLEEQTTTRRLRTHRKAAEAIEALHADDLDPYVTELAYHYGEVAAAEPGKARQYATRAGERAASMAAPDDAVHWFTRALALADDADVESRVELLTRLGQAEWASGVGEAAAHLRDAARMAKDAGLHRALAEALLVKVRTSYAVGGESDPEKIELLEHALAHITDEPALRARLLGDLARELVFVGDRTRRQPLIDEAQALAEDSGDPLTIVDVAACSFDAADLASMTVTRARQAQSYATAALRAAETLDEPHWISQMLTWNLVAAAVLNDGDAFRSFTSAVSELAGATPAMTVNRIVFPQMLASMEGRLVEAEALSLEMLHVRGIAPQEALAYAAVMQLGVRREQGRLAEMVPMLRVASERPQVGALLAFILAETGALDEAASVLHDKSSNAFRDLPDDLSWPLVAAMWCEAAVLTRDRDSAQRLYELALPTDGTTWGSGGIVCGPVARLLAQIEDLLDRPDDADRHFAASIEQSQSLGSAVWTARCQLDWAESLLARVETSRARGLVDAADATIGPLTLPALQQRAAGLRDRLVTPR
jgi:class 3 adenylate cyclase